MRGRGLKFGKERKKERERMLNDKRGNDGILKKLRNGTLEERERERVYQEKLKRNGGWVIDSMERRRWGFE